MINPSLFEGWSTSVEEAKSLDKRILLSNIPVHREQAPARGIYFDPQDAADLAFKLKQVWAKDVPETVMTHPQELEKNLNQRTENFGEAYQQVVLKIIP